jgi:thioredoxin reductase (NADPH)
VRARSRHIGFDPESHESQDMTEAPARHAPIVIIGSGPAGYTAAIYTARAMRKPMLIAGLQPGGQMTITTDVENYPGFADVIQGPWLMEQMRAQAKHVGTEIVDDIITSVDFSKRPFRMVGDSGQVYLADSVIIATGAQAKWLGLPAEQHFGGHGVSACATCDGFFYRGKDVAVIGGGNSAVEEALYLAHLARKVTIIHRRDSFKAEKILQERLFNHPSIEVVWDSVLEDIEGTSDPKSVTGIVIRKVKTGEREERKVDGVFVAIGHAPATEIFKGQVEMRDNGYIKVKPGTTETNIPGVYAAGDVADDVYRQAVTAAGLGCMAALEAEKFLAAQELDRARAKAGAAA